MSTMLVCGEAKCRARKLANRPNATVYGFLTDSVFWEFVRIDNESKVWTASVSSLTDAITWLRYILDCAERSTPSTTPTTSNDDLRNNELDNFKIVVERFRTIEGDESEDEEEEEEDAGDLVARMAKIDISSKD
ncbi:hypothetical protein BDK51DRAFT_34710 [Blyttiomyces helicus]|uniref:Uncharacterized protein n=1 Tax=Blyttiomyces helicus TaxID=388810 RepID=A0A4P9W3N3_9FUNG|nr:hypothetical protein BDK51DRAFT_34710 [Blyttiomyces helicus]|eukprot:RKO85398.1 hypothetical protein BDK51DRAFT_34710 [Blyttiomyces helicus]